MSYQSYSVSLTEGQKANLARAYKNMSPITIRLKNEQLRGNFPLLLTKTQINRINKSIAGETGVDIGISKKQISAQNKNGGFLGAYFLARTVLPTVARIAPKVVAPLAAGTHWVCYVDSFYFDPFGLPPLENILFIKRYNISQYQEKISVLCGYFCLFFIKKFQDGNSFYNILYKKPK